MHDADRPRRNLSATHRYAYPYGERGRCDTGRRVVPLHLAAVLLIVLGLAVSVPASCWCPPDDHFGVLLHPLFPHSHGQAHTPDASATAQPDPAVDEAPGLSAPLGEAGGRGAMAGLLLPTLLGLLLAGTARWHPSPARRPPGRVTRPPTPPPRLLPAAR